MSCLCIGGVCIPYSALLPALFIALQWVASKLAKVGLLPDFVAKRMGLTSSGKKVAGGDGSCDMSGCCGGGSAKKSAARSDSVVTTATSSSSDGEGSDAEVEHVDSLERWEEVFAATKKSTLFVKFTADWCKPCKAIHPAYVSAASKHESCTFITLDIDGDDCDVLSSKLKVAMMPTFVCFKGGNEAGRMSGGNSEDKLHDWVAEMCS